MKTPLTHELYLCRFSLLFSAFLFQGKDERHWHLKCVYLSRFSLFHSQAKPNFFCYNLVTGIWPLIPS